MNFDLDKAIRKIKDFPKEGILFYDITSIFINPLAFEFVINKAFTIYKDQNIDTLIAVESRGFLFASTLAYKMKKPLVLARKSGKLPGKTIKEEYKLEYGTASLEIHIEDMPPKRKVLIVDDLIATGGTLKAIATMIEKLDSEVAGVFGVIGLPFLNYSKKLDGYKITTLIDYDSE